MTIIPLKLPQGMFRNGTPYAARGRWYDGNLVRWHDNALRPIGGWTRRQDANGDVPSLVSDPDTETVRDILPYITNTGTTQTMFASNQGLTLMTGANGLVPLTTTGFTPGLNDTSALFGYGIGPYSRGFYGTRRNTFASLPQPVQRWSMDMWGENVLAAGTENGPLFEITPAGVVNTLGNAPTEIQDFVVTDERIVLSLVNNSTDVRQVVWSDRENNNVWSPAVNNFAGSQVLQGTGNLVGCYKVLNQTLILSETDAHIARYIGAPFVFGFDRVGTNCAPVHHKAVVTTDRFAMWLGRRNFWMYDGTLRQVPCEVIDHISETISEDGYSKINAHAISEYSEIWWFYQSNGAMEVDSYVVFDYVENHWQIGKLTRTGGADAGVYGRPIMVDADGFVFDHEQPAVLVEGAFALTGPLELLDGAKNMAVRYVLPDTEQFGSVQLEFITKQMPTDTPITHGPYDYLNPISTTGVLGREVQMRVNGLTSGWEVGQMRLDIQEVGGGFR